MSLQLTRDTIRVETVLGESSAELTLRETLGVPRGKPPVDDSQGPGIIEAVARPRMERAELVDGGVRVSGDLEIHVIYVAETEGRDQPVAFMILEGLSFDHILECDVAEHDEDVRVTADVEVVALDLDVARPDQLDASAVVAITVRVTELAEINVVTGAAATPPSRISIDRELVRVEDILGESGGQVAIEAGISLPVGRPKFDMDLPDPILTVRGYPKITEAKAADDRVLLEGELWIDLAYVSSEGLRAGEPEEPEERYGGRYDEDEDEAEREEGSGEETGQSGFMVHFARVGPVRFAHSIDVPGAAEGARVSVSAKVEDLVVTAKNGVEAGVSAVLELSVRAVQDRQMYVVTDILSETDQAIDVDKKTIRVHVVVGREEMATPVREALSIPRGRLPIAQGGLGVLNARGTARVTSVEVMEDRVKVNGALDVYILYAAEGGRGTPGQVIHFANLRDIEFSTTVEVRGARPGHSAHANVAVEDIEVESDGGRDVEVRAVLRTEVRVTRPVELDVVTEAEIVSPVTRDPSIITFYVVQPGDSLWKIARRYGTTVEAITKVNDIPDPDRVAVGQKVLIPK